LLYLEDDQREVVSGRAWQMMAKMGYHRGNGLRKDEQGIQKFTFKTTTTHQGLGYSHFEDYQYGPPSCGLYDHFVKGTTKGGTQVCECESLEEEADPLKLEAASLSDDDEVYNIAWLFDSEVEASSRPESSIWRLNDPREIFIQPPRARRG